MLYYNCQEGNRKTITDRQRASETLRGKEKNMEEMGMTDKQFNGFVRFLLDALKEAREEKESDKQDEKLDKIIDNLQKTLED